MVDLLRRFALILFLACAFAAPARADDAAVQTTWRLLDYVAVDYRGAVQDGRIISQFEYDEMVEFSRTVRERIAALPAHRERQSLVDAAGRLQAEVAAKAAPLAVERDARALGAALLAAYPVPMAPSNAPNLARGQTLFQENCSACHGADGSARVAAAAALDPPPIDFTDRSRARDRSLFALYQVTSQGLEGTSMQSFAHLPDADRWALAFRAGQFAYPASLIEAGRQLWKTDPAVRAAVPDLPTLVSLTPSALAVQIGEDKAAAVTAFLRAYPETVVATRSTASTLETGRVLLDQSLQAYQAGDRARATELALAAYLDGFEPIEALLGARDASLVAKVEAEMGELRAAIGRGRPAGEVKTRVERLQALFGASEKAVAPEASSGMTTFLGAFAILLREGLEALLIVIAMITFLVRAERRDLLRYVHAGWGTALIAGVATWWIATRLINISGADRELTEGFGALTAAIILIFVGIWMHGKSQAGAWQAYVQETIGRAVGRGSAWLLFGLCFIAVYREVFETIIFYAAIGAQGQNGAMLAGVLVAALVLALIAWAMLKLSRRLPIAQFFRYSAVLIAVLAVVLAGKGVAALQEAGLIGVTPLAGLPRSPILGLFPTAETIIAQLVTAALIAAGFLRAARRPEPIPA